MLGVIVAVGLFLAAQANDDPRLQVPGCAVGSRMQMGANAFPANWGFVGGLGEPFTDDKSLVGFRIITIEDPKNPKKDPPGIGGFLETPCEFLGTTPVVTLFTQDGEKHRFTLDTGALRSYVRPSLAQSFNNGSFDPFPMAWYLGPSRWVHVKVEVDPNVGILAGSPSDFPVDGILGMNAIACLDLKIDYRERKLYTRLSSKSLDEKTALAEFGDRQGTIRLDMSKQGSGRYAVSTLINDKPRLTEVDTGANVLGLSPKEVAGLGLEQVGEGAVLMQGGSRKIGRYLATTASLGDLKFLWPVVSEAPTQEEEIGGLGPAIFPSRTVVIDYPDLRLYTAKPTQDDQVEQALGQIISGAVRLDHDRVLMDMPDLFGSGEVVLTKVQDKPVSTVLADIRAWSKGNVQARTRLLKLYEDLGANGHISIRKNGKDSLVRISPPPAF